MAGNQAAASLLPVDKNKLAKVSPLPGVLVDVDVKPLSSISPPLPVTPVDYNIVVDSTPVAVRVLPLMVCMWALVNAFVFAVGGVLTLILNRTPCTKSTWLFRCVTVTDAAAAELGLLLYGELLCSAAAALAAPLHMWLTMTATTRSRMRSRWGAAIDALAWAALAAASAMHCMEVASDRIFLAAKPGDNYIFADVVCGSVFFAVDMLAGVLLCCSPRRLELGGQRGHNNGEV